MNPEEGADASAVGAGGHGGGDVEVGVEVEGASGVGGEDGEIFGLDLVHVGLVDDTETAATEIVNTVSVVGRHGLADADIVGGVSSVTTVQAMSGCAEEMMVASLPWGGGKVGC